MTFGVRPAVSDILRVGEEVGRPRRADEIAHVILDVLGWDSPTEEQI